ncbi:cell adhesion molecule 1-like [Leptopilina heterotoma]|uniref:cell adhesion molecule 1-like n=1 Tax=Leptopilina heterotoma TaxID=63436 RepID=UPI001CA97641|nr:cell adhesion molecule 1-like [Leptopilina heterotoma]XP_043463876.1 cell adhesion molecule 1-like [Leptopilina heterotoma]XP_043463877.1 cell adhesion molecule 1-like [Leptopilina heterotoma]XP_043463878.1 cell adhesion molecule 1-like [Leptopilina heterotoma]XP_043463879.1 cell adhesion molecule 1-like [Leptopilina heterotoma]
MDFVLLVLMALWQQGVGALRLLEIKVPTYTVKGQSTILQCSYDLQSDKLYSVSWYKDNESFYMYKPKSETKKNSFQVDGVKVDLVRSDHQKVHLKHVELHAAGKYKCEVSVDRPDFETSQKEEYMEVIVLPQDGPIITGQENIYASGDNLSLNCTSGKTHPKSLLRWFINGIQVNPDAEIIMSQQHGLYVVISSLRIEVGPHHINSGQMKIRCESILQTSQATSPIIDSRKAEILVHGHATLYTPSLLLLISMLLLRHQLVH